MTRLPRRCPHIAAVWANVMTHACQANAAITPGRYRESGGGGCPVPRAITTGMTHIAPLPTVISNNDTPSRNQA